MSSIGVLSSDGWWLVADAGCDAPQEEQERNRRILAALEDEKSDLASRHQQLAAMLDQTKVCSAAGHLAGDHPVRGGQSSAAEQGMRPDQP